MNISDVILKLLEKDEERAFQLLFEHYYDSLLLYSFRILNDLEAAEDVIQDCLEIYGTPSVYGILKEILMLSFLPWLKSGHIYF